MRSASAARDRAVCRIVNAWNPCRGQVTVLVEADGQNYGPATRAWLQLLGLSPI